MQAYEQLQYDLELKSKLPVTPDWSAAADFLMLIKEYCLNEKPVNIVECSSGLTTIILTRCCQLNECGRVYSLENGKQYQLQTLQNLKAFQLENYADTIYAPLEEVVINNLSYDWYKTDDLPNVKIDMLVIDGPPGLIQKHSRMPALPVLFEHMADISTVFLDDAARNEEKAIVDMWLGLHTGISHEYIETERGCSVLRINKT